MSLVRAEYTSHYLDNRDALYEVRQCIETMIRRGCPTAHKVGVGVFTSIDATMSFNTTTSNVSVVVSVAY